MPHYLGKFKRLPYIAIIIINTGKTLVGLMAFVRIRRKRAAKQRKLELVAVIDGSAGPLVPRP